ncbi:MULTISPECIES: hypothetical protein [unclassified Pantoea]|uniref:hypothetical protein n=1 Tax=unclassified Pantoea TaxID=2630326 RepID=UPI001232C877|nr:MULTISPECIES: hypothetical protein [unclassified Pantoea]KAA5957681.1 hypothetical protein F3I53_15620 [Pantoea sp. VH_16]KAA6105006.1 hypothetical protein F3I25_15510 [Pantoea sp. Bo_14]KAA6108600.1 hypothetical protein F3I23_14365 [Pantoea sp. Bo_11]
MNFSLIRQSMTDDACEIVSALSQSPAITLQAILFITKGKPHTTRFILEQMAVRGLAADNNGLWQLTEAFRASACRATAQSW